MNTNPPCPKCKEQSSVVQLFGIKDGSFSVFVESTRYQCSIVRDGCGHRWDTTDDRLVIQACRDRLSKLLVDNTTQGASARALTALDEWIESLPSSAPASA